MTDFGDTVVREVMVPRPDMVTVTAAATVREALELAVFTGVSRVPHRVVRTTRSRGAPRSGACRD